MCNVFGDAIHQLHNVGLLVPQSETYVDDGTIATPKTTTSLGLERYCAIIDALYGRLGISTEKCEIAEVLILNAIGWRWEVRRIGPRQRGLAKIFLVLLYSFPPEKTRVSDYGQTRGQ